MIASISVVTYNRKALTETCLQSIIMNTPPKAYELIVIDNASTDGTRELLEDYLDCGLIDKYHANPENRHLGFAINQAYEMAEPQAVWLITFANDEYAMPDWFDNFLKVAGDLNPDYVYCMMRIATFMEKQDAWTPGGGHYMLPPKEPEIGATFAIRQHDQREKQIWFNPTPWQPGYGSPFSVLKHQLDAMGLKGVELAKPCVLIQNCRFNDPAYADYYAETFGVRGRLDRWERLKQTANYVDKDTLKEYYRGSGYNG